MGCCSSKVDNLPLVIRCRERKELLKAAADHRYEFAAAHLSYFLSLKDVGEALRRFVDEELVVATSSSSTTTTTSSPVVTLHPIDDDDEEEEEEKKEKGEVKTTRSLDGDNGKRKSKSKSKGKNSRSGLHHSHHNHDTDENESHLHLSSSDSDDASHVHLHHEDEDEDNRGRGGGGEGPYSYPDSNDYSVPYGYGMMNQNQPPPEMYWGPFPNYFGPNQPYQAWAPPTYENPNVNYRHTNVHYMKKSSPVMKTVIHETAPATNGFSSSSYGYPYENEGFYGFPMGQPQPQPGRDFEGRKPSVPADPPPPPSPKGSTWDFLNPFDAFDSVYSQGYYSQSGNGNGYGYGSSVSSPDSAEVRKREGIPDLEEETENEVYREVEKGKKVKEDVKRSYSGEGSSRSRGVPLHKSGEDIPERVRLRKSTEGGPKTVPLHRSNDGSSRSVPMPSSEEQFTEKSSRDVPSENHEATGSIHLSEEMSSSDTVLSSKSPEDLYVKKKEVSFEVDETSKPDMESSKLSSLTALSPHGTRDLQEVVAEIRDEFAIASSYGKDVAVLLEVGKLPFQPNFFRGII